jgi:hypothetical protein
MRRTIATSVADILKVAIEAAVMAIASKILNKVLDRSEEPVTLGVRRRSKRKVDSTEVQRAWDSLSIQ